ncbi:MAG: aminopeptidase P family protein [Oscillospiraceae bacterium]|nr:aminopeptidase P family protein [Oscillospiraceae bacterium]
MGPRTAALVASTVDRRRLTGFDSSDGLLFIAPRAAVFLTDSRYIEAARAEISACPVEELKDAAAQLRALCGEHRVKRLFVETEHTTLAQAARLRRDLPGVWVEDRDGRADKHLRALRMHKTPAEAARIRQAQGIAEKAFEYILGMIKPGMSEREIALELDYAMLRGGARAVSFETIAVAGENGSKPHGAPGDRPLRRGDLLTLDFGAVIDGYHSDMTRTVAIGEPGEEQRRIYEIVLEAQRAALEKLAPGVFCKEIDAAARGVVGAAGYGEHFRHGTGHGVGLEIHEAPSLSRKSRDVLAPGMVVTVEPGIYLPGKCGVRIEDMALITETGHENLTRAEKELIVVH